MCTWATGLGREDHEKAFLCRFWYEKDTSKISHGCQLGAGHSIARMYAGMGHSG